MGTYTRKELEQLLHDRYYGKFCHLYLPLQKEIYGICDSIILDHKGDVVIQIKDKRFECSLECFQEYLDILSNPKEKINHNEQS